LAFFEKADVKGTRAVFEALPSSIKEAKWVRSTRIYLAICSRDFAAADAIISQDPTEELFFLRELQLRVKSTHSWWSFLKESIVAE
jgi:hypothetical protein